MTEILFLQRSLDKFYKSSEEQQQAVKKWLKTEVGNNKMISSYILLQMIEDKIKSVTQKNYNEKLEQFKK